MFSDVKLLIEDVSIYSDGRPASRYEDEDKIYFVTGDHGKMDCTIPVDQQEHM